MGAFLRKYNAATSSGTHIGLPMIKAGSSDFAVSADWTPAAGDVKVSIDGGTQANIATLPAYTNGQWIFQLSGAETTGKSIRVAVVDAATKAVEDQFFVIETFGHASAMYATDYTAALAPASTALSTADWTGALADDLTTFLGGTGPTTADLAAAIWSALLSGSAFSTSGGVGTALKAFLAASPVPLSDIAAAVWADAPDGVPLSDIRDAVWSALLSGTAFSTSGGAGTALKAFLTASPVPYSDIAEAVWADATAQALIAAGDIGLNDAVTGGSPTTTTFRGSNSLSSADDYYIGSWLAPTSGALKGQSRKITAYAGSTRTFTFDVAWPGAIANGTPFVIFGHSS